jgi:hypothetical protein
MSIEGGGTVKAVLIKIGVMLRESFTEDGKGSAGRFSMFAVVIVWSYIALRTRAIPERTMEAALMACTFYGVSRFSQVAALFAAYRTGQRPPETPPK